MHAKKYVGVRLLDAPFAIDREYSYAIPDGLEESVARGCFVSVPFGGGDRARVALVTSCSDKPPEGVKFRIKPILKCFSEGMRLSDELCNLCLWTAEQTLSSVGDVVHAALPAFAISTVTDLYRVAQNPPDGAVPARGKERDALEALRKAEASARNPDGVRADALCVPFAKDIGVVLSSLVAKGLVLRTPTWKDAHAAKETRIYALAEGAETVKLRSEAHKRVLTWFSERPHAEAEESLLREQLFVTRAQLAALEEKGVLCARRQDAFRDPVQEAEPTRTVTLNGEQSEAFRTLSGLLDGKPHAALLHGVTGSGKTSVMLALCDKVLAEGKGVILLLPEIALTPQTLRIFCGRYGDRVAVIHSGLSSGERYDAYRRIRSGAATLVIGTRSAVFSPVQSLSLIVIDEEQEHTYKSDQNPKYNARDVARFRCASVGALLLLASATPSVESYKKALDGVYTLVKLEHRYGDAVLPEVKIADMRREAGGGQNPIGSELLCEMLRVQKAGEQSLLFLNRRGYHRCVSCRDCGKPVLCPNCSVAMTHHTPERAEGEGYLVCHLCGTRAPLPAVCPACGSSHLGRVGYGTQRIEKELSDLFPEARVMRMDADSVSAKNAYGQMLGAFRRHEADVLVGTQMVAKGHDFPDLTLVGVLNADAALFADDYRAKERTFQMLTQVVGRAGRSHKAGLAVIQTENPDSDVLRLASAQDYEGFYRDEIKLREQLVFPPFCDMAVFTVVSPVERNAAAGARTLRKAWEDKTAAGGAYADVRYVLFGPFESPVYRLENKYRLRVVVKCVLNKRSRALCGELLRETAGKDFPAAVSLDLNPTSLS